jgi:predicted MFS family arabinose efflux permease
MIGRRRDRPNDPSHVSGFSLAIPRDTWICCLIIFLYYGGLTPFETFGVDYLVTEYGMSRTDAGQALALIPFFSFFSPVISSLVSSVKRQIIGVVLAQVIVATSIVLEMVQFEYAPHVYLCSMGIGHMIVANALWLALASVTPTEAQKTNAASVSSAIYAVSTFAFNWMTGRVRDATGGYESAFAGLAFLVLLGASTGVYLLEWGRWKNTVANSQAHRVLLDTTDLNDVHVTTGNNPGLIVEDHFVPTGNGN